ncbi:four helix bundle protein [Thermocoleostomius sinensis]|jgi:four helix bundle protein|uniref:Four helix bundle protein n=1 Tax=Thermocoleostomius sinensis A174 TaxID=2016057 RepID=A0A9E8ZA28_9CYAN|nr:four helix bundle protein [Thermocoleostomius sinensis]WAL59338.1 four helix bundle protein [Thermocoleostomius sinensis A174]
MEENVLQTKSFEFAIGVIRLYRKLQARQEFVLSPHILRSGTGIGMKLEQASAERDHQKFLEKLAAVMNEAREAKYWLRLLQESKLTDVDVSRELQQIEAIIQQLDNYET